VHTGPWLMDPAYFSAFAALGGSVIGGLTSLATSWLVQRTQARAQQSTQNFEKKQALYKDFIEESTRLYADALEHDKTDVSNLVRLYALISRMRVLSAPAVVDNAEKLARTIVETYLGPNMALREFRSMVADQHAVDPFRDFSLACRDELHRLGAF
jgi:hypothetical protein